MLMQNYKAQCDVLSSLLLFSSHSLSVLFVLPDRLLLASDRPIRPPAGLLCEGGGSAAAAVVDEHSGCF